MKLFKIIASKFIYFLFLSGFSIITLSSIFYLYEKRDKIEKKVKKTFRSKVEENYKYNPIEKDIEWAEKILKGGYILHFRHAERDKWIDVQMYDALESDLHNNGLNESRYAENDYFDNAVCLNERGKIQAKAMGEHIQNIGLPISYVVSSVSCRARQTATLAFGGYDSMNRLLVHEGPYNEIAEDRINKIRSFYLSLPYNKNGNVIVSSHNGVIRKQMFDAEPLKDLSLEEGGFYVISNKDGKLIFEYEFHNFNAFNKVFYIR